MASLPLPTQSNPLLGPPKSMKTKNSTQIHEANLSKSLGNVNGGVCNTSFLHQISSLAKQGLNHEAFRILNQMEADEIPVGPEIYGELLQGCVYERALREGQQIHARILKNGSFFSENEYLVTKLLVFYAKCNCSTEAGDLFGRLRRPNVFSWAAMIGLNCRNGFHENALLGFCEMVEIGVFPDNFVVPNALKSCSALQLVGIGRGIHGYAMKIGFGECVYVLSSLVDFYGKCGVLEDALKVFAQIPERNVVSWNSMLVSFLQNGLDEETLQLFSEMRVDGVQPTRVSITSFLSASANVEAVDEGRQAHAIAVTSGLELDNILELGRVGHGFCIRNNLDSDLSVMSAVIDLYSSCGKMELAQRVFDVATSRDLVVWNTLIFAYAQYGLSGEALKHFYQMQLHGLHPNVVSWNSIILGLLQNRQVKEALDMFSQMQFTGVNPTLITWTTLIFGLALNGCGYEAIWLFGQMLSMNIRPSAMVIAGVILACAHMVSIWYGRVIHGYIMKKGFLSSVSVAVSLIDMYAKCGSIDLAKKVFDMVSNKEMPVYNAMLSGYALHRQAREALELYQYMQHFRTKPDEITFTALLSACSHAGLADEAVKVFTEMISIYHIKPQREHYDCMVSLLVNRGSFEEACRIISALPFKPDDHVVRSLLTLCKEHYMIKLDEKDVPRHKFMVEPENSVNYVSFAKIHAAHGRWHGASRIATLMRMNGLRKDCGSS
ncbi:pentatricopeptide repeat-containing protein At5g55740, chloroplastic [Dioscorea cayenensis subsp. rotundata]|uniref:Pentatricopeptide repeat-containing protein At5g55740, chloroplastic n=1 Tax=Dioscorea cayennensis subsp. rotundata TaxID=55577 RepID=A0AB40B976_DIOCR|nr:pentatricopeptide repeat-containing protein At5g55740, chloroplastic [Dioscorea cayenensis subsp. rotundata]